MLSDHCKGGVFRAGGSGSAYIYGFCDKTWRPGMSESDCVAFVQCAVQCFPGHLFHNKLPCTFARRFEWMRPPPGRSHYVRNACPSITLAPIWSPPLRLKANISRWGMRSHATALLAAAFAPSSSVRPASSATSCPMTRWRTSLPLYAP